MRHLLHPHVSYHRFRFILLTLTINTNSYFSSYRIKSKIFNYHHETLWKNLYLNPISNVILTSKKTKDTTNVRRFQIQWRCDRIKYNFALFSYWTIITSIKRKPIERDYSILLFHWNTTRKLAIAEIVLMIQIFIFQSFIARGRQEYRLCFVDSKF